MSRARLLIVDDEPVAADHVMHLLGATGMAIQSVNGGDEALRSAQAADDRGQPFDVILVDYHMPDVAGVDVLKGLGERGINSHVILMSGQESSNVAVEAMKLGAFDFISKPFDRAELELRITRALRDRQTSMNAGQPVRKLRKSDVIIGGSASVKQLYEHINMVAPTDVTVAISGESGTGKELVARTIHNLSPRYQRPFVVVNCAAIPEPLLEKELFGHIRGAFTDATEDRPGLLAAAHTGTLFLDEIGDMPLTLQAKVLRVLQSREVRRVGDHRATHIDVRIITATNRNLEAAVANGSFRQDLFYRINVFPIALPPLRERRDDIPLLAHHFLLAHRDKFGKSVMGFSPGALAKLQRHSFPGNVRELENLIHHALVLTCSTLIEPEDIPLGHQSPGLTTPLDLSRTFRDLKREVVESFERQYVRRLLRTHQGNVAAAARQAGMHRKNLWSLTRKYQIDPEQFRNPG